MKLARSSSLAERVYGAMLVFYPSVFRQAYSTQMRLCFRDCWQRAQSEGVLGQMSFAIDTLIDLVFSLIKQHFHEVITMNETARAKLFAIATMISGLGWVILWAMMMSDLDAFIGRSVKIVTIGVVYPLIAVSTIGLGRLMPSSRLGKIATFMGVVLLGISLIGVFAEDWILFSLPLSLFFIAYMVLGVLVIKHKPFSAFNWLPLTIVVIFILGGFVANPYNYAAQLKQAWGTELFQYTSTFIFLESLQRGLLMLAGVAWLLVGVLMWQKLKRAILANE
jgi:hypothetical protein